MARATDGSSRSRDAQPDASKRDARTRGRSAGCFGQVATLSWFIRGHYSSYQRDADSWCASRRGAHAAVECAYPSGEEGTGARSRQPPAAGLISRQQDTYFIPPPSRAVGGARGRSVPVSTATLGLIHRQDPALAALLREEPQAMMSQRTRLRVYSTMRLIRTGLIGQMASLQQWEDAMLSQDE